MPRRIVRPWILFSGIWRVVSANKELGMLWPRSVTRFRINANSTDKKRRIGEVPASKKIARASPCIAVKSICWRESIRSWIALAELWRQRRLALWLAREVGPAACLSGKRTCSRYFCASPISPRTCFDRVLTEHITNLIAPHDFSSCSRHDII